MKLVTFIIERGVKRAIILGKYEGCPCRLTETQRQAMKREAAKEAGVL